MPLISLDFIEAAAAGVNEAIFDLLAHARDKAEEIYNIEQQQKAQARQIEKDREELEAERYETCHSPEGHLDRPQLAVPMLCRFSVQRVSFEGRDFIKWVHAFAMLDNLGNLSGCSPVSYTHLTLPTTSRG